MLKKTITYKDYNGNERTEDFYFNLNKAELMEMEMSTAGGLAETVDRIIKAQDAPTIIKIFKKLFDYDFSVIENALEIDCFSTIKENVIGKTIDTIVTNNPIILCLPNL